MLYVGHKIIAIIPALNEESTIAKVVCSARNYSDIIIVVDDGSLDGTRTMAEQRGALVIYNGKNLGYESSIEIGFKKAAELGATIFVTLDADGQHNSKDIARLVNLIVTDQTDIALGDRIGCGRKIFESVIAFYVRARFQINDPLCGLKAYSRKVYERFGYFDTMKLIGAQLAIEGRKSGFRCINIPIETMPRSDRSRFYSQNIRANLKTLKAFYRILCLGN